MAPNPSSRFAALETMTTAAPDGSVRHVIALRLLRERLPISGRHHFSQGEGPDLLAYRYYGDEDLWWRILDANPLIYPLDLEPGALLDIPGPGPATAANRARSF